MRADHASSGHLGGGSADMRGDKVVAGDLQPALCAQVHETGPMLDGNSPPILPRGERVMGDVHLGSDEFQGRKAASLRVGARSLRKGRDERSDGLRHEDNLRIANRPVKGAICNTQIICR